MGMKVFSRGSLGNEGKGLWGIKVFLRGSLGNEGMVKGIAA